MTQEEKLEEAKRLYETANADQRYVLESLFPELKKSEDEKIRKLLITFFINDYGKNSNARFAGIKVKDIISWLEKQAQKTFGFNNSDTIEHNLNDYCCKIYSALHKENGGVLSFARLQHMAMDIYGWCKEQGEQKPLNEEDEAHIDSLLKRLEGMCKPDATFTSTGFAISEDEDWLKDLKDRVQPQWKPSDEQIDALLKLEEMHVLEHEKNQENAHLYMVVKSLREQLLKLREE